jgi:DNA-binding response OmpR family regulator
MPDPRPPSPPIQVLVVEDDAELRALVADSLRTQGFVVEAVGDVAALDRALARAVPDVLLLDIMLPGGEDGLAACRRLRAGPHAALPVLLLTARGEEVDRVLGLEFGADDYVTKPFSVRELAARIRAVLRRARPSLEAAAASRLAFNGWLLDVGARCLVNAEGTPLELTTAEFDLLACLAARPFRVLTRDQIMDLTRLDPAAAFDRAVDVTLSRLRRKLQEAGASPNLIKTVRNAGYMFAAPVREG